MSRSTTSRTNTYIFDFLAITVVSFVIIFMQFEQVSAIETLSQNAIKELQDRLIDILAIKPPINIPRGGTWDNHYCNMAGGNLENGPDAAHQNVLKLAVVVRDNETVDMACQRRMKDLISVAANRLINNAAVTVNEAGEYTITPLLNNRGVTPFRFKCYKRGNEVQGPNDLVLQFNAARDGFAHIYPT